MVSLRILIVDDDPRACELLRYHLTRSAPHAHVLAEIHSFSEAQRRLGQNDYEVVFLDVQLHDGNGFDLVRYVGPDAAIIFVTGHDAHALRAFEVNAVDYIVKPVATARLLQALRRIHHVRPPASSRRRLRSDDRVFLRGAAAGGKFVAVADIVAIISSENYCEVCISSGEKWLVRRTMSEWEEMLPEEIFLRVHRTALINVGRVENLERNAAEHTTVHVSGLRATIPVARRNWVRLKALLNRDVR